jgi:hypothetical protein
MIWHRFRVPADVVLCVLDPEAGGGVLMKGSGAALGGPRMVMSLAIVGGER